MKVQFDLAHSQVTIEGDGPDLMAVLQAVRELAPKLSEIRITTSAAVQPPIRKDELKGNGAERPQKQGGATMREFARAINPTNMTERIIAIGAYVERNEGRTSFSAKEMGDWFTICGFQKPAQMSVALFDAKRKYGFVDKAGHGQWRLSTAGENLVTRKLEENGGDS